jgi:hypothetical protein
LKALGVNMDFRVAVKDEETLEEVIKTGVLAIPLENLNEDPSQGFGHYKNIILSTRNVMGKNTIRLIARIKKAGAIEDGVLFMEFAKTSVRAAMPDEEIGPQEPVEQSAQEKERLRIVKQLQERRKARWEGR